MALEEFAPAGVLIVFAVAIAFLILNLSRILGPHNPTSRKTDPYESGMDPVGEARDRYSIAFYLVAMEFIVFDLEVVFIYPWAVAYLNHGVGTFFAMVIFIIVLFIGLIYTLKKGTLDWDMKSLKYKATKQ